MTEVLCIVQDPIRQLTDVQISEDEICREPTVRRASPDFAYEVGGPVLKRFLDEAAVAGHVHDTSLVMSQPSDFRQGALSTPQYWHFDFIPGMAPDTDEAFKSAIYGNIGLIACAFSTDEHPDDVGTLFLQGGAVALDLANRNRAREYVPRQNLNLEINEGKVYWWDPTVRQQVTQSKGLTVTPLTPNRIYEYGSHHIHRVPVMRSNQGQRILMRINTPTDPEVKPIAENTCIRQDDPAYPRYVFYATGPDTWMRDRIQHHPKPYYGYCIDDEPIRYSHKQYFVKECPPIKDEPSHPAE